MWNYTTPLEHFLNETPDYLPRFARLERNLTPGRAKRKWVGGEGIFARPRFPPPPNFVFRFAKCAAKNFV